MIRANPYTRISKTLKLLLILVKPFKRLLRSSLQNHNLKRTHQHNRIQQSMLVLRVRIMVYHTPLVLRIIQNSHHLADVPMSHREIQRAKIIVERLIEKFLKVNLALHCRLKSRTSWLSLLVLRIRMRSKISLNLRGVDYF